MAQVNLGELLRAGDCNRDIVEAAFWYRKSADQGNGLAQYQLARLMIQYPAIFSSLANDQLVRSEAVSWLRKSAEQGIILAQFGLAELLWVNENDKAYKSEAAIWFRKSAEQGHAESQAFQADLLRIGNGLDENKSEAAFWYRKSADQGNHWAQYSLADMLWAGEGVEENKAAAALMFRNLANERNGLAMLRLSQMLALGDGVANNPEEADAWLMKERDSLELLPWLKQKRQLFRILAKQGHQWSQYCLAMILQAEDQGEAFYWYDLSAKQGNPFAKNAIREYRDPW